MSHLRFRSLLAAGLLLPLAVAGCGNASVSASQQDWSGNALVPPSIPSEVIGELNGVEITLADLADRDRFRLAQLKSDYFTESHRALEEAALTIARERVIEQAAAELGISVHEYHRDQIGIPEVPETELRRVYDANREQLGERPFEEVVPEIRRQMASQMLSRAVAQRSDALLREAEWELRVPPYRVHIDTEGHAAAGPADAPVTVVVFSDFECPYCRRFNVAMDQVREEFGDRVRLVFRHYPLRTIHPLAQKAGEAAVCAQDQGMFWEYHDALWTDPSLDPATLQRHARMVGLDTEEFGECLDSGRNYARVQRDAEAAMNLGQSGTPAVFVNGRKVGGAIGYAQFRTEIERELPDEEPAGAEN